MTPAAPSAPALVCIGNLTVDEAHQPDGRITTAVGGDALFAALAARLSEPGLSERVRILAPIGVDAPDGLRAAVELAGTSPAVLPLRDEPTVRNAIDYAADGTRRWTLVHGEEHFDRLSVRPADVPAEALAARGILVTAMSLESQLELVPWLRSHSAATIYLDLQEDYLEHREALLGIVADCDVFLPSEVEAAALARTADPLEAAAFFATLGPSVVVVKRAELGYVIATPGQQPVAVAVEPVEPVDSTGAGDSFCGAFAAVHLATGDVAAAARAGAAAARVALSAPGIDGLAAAVRERIGSLA